MGGVANLWGGGPATGSPGEVTRVEGGFAALTCGCGKGVLGSAGTGGCFVQTCSPSSARATGWLQLEHFTVGRTWLILVRSTDGAKSEAIADQERKGSNYGGRPACISMESE
jgi:hypothetical protein